MSGTSNKTSVNDLLVFQACCCNITGVTCKYPECWGFGVDGICLCIKSNCVVCKLMDERKNDEGKMFTCTEGGLFCVKPTTCCQFQEQCCCLDTRCALPCTNDVPMICTLLPCCVVYPACGCCKKVKDITLGNEAARGGKDDPQWDLSEVPVGQVRVCQACCCNIAGLNFAWPQCFGMKMEGICCCLQCERSCCKIIQEVNDDQICCICCDGGGYVVMPTTCIQSTQTICCLDVRCALPCTEKVPCILTCLPGCTVCANKEMKVACCPKVEDIIEGYKNVEVSQVAPAPKEAAPSQVEMN